MNFFKQALKLKKNLQYQEAVQKFYLSLESENLALDNMIEAYDFILLTIRRGPRASQYAKVLDEYIDLLTKHKAYSKIQALVEEFISYEQKVRPKGQWFPYFKKLYDISFKKGDFQKASLYQNKYLDYLESHKNSRLGLEFIHQCEEYEGKHKKYALLIYKIKFLCFIADHKNLKQELIYFNDNWSLIKVKIRQEKIDFQKRIQEISNLLDNSSYLNFFEAKEFIFLQHKEFIKKKQNQKEDIHYSFLKKALELIIEMICYDSSQLKCFLYTAEIFLLYSVKRKGEKVLDLALQENDKQNQNNKKDRNSCQNEINKLRKIFNDIKEEQRELLPHLEFYHDSVIVEDTDLAEDLLYDVKSDDEKYNTYYAYSFKGQTLLDLREKRENLEDLLIQELQKYQQSDDIAEQENFRNDCNFFEKERQKYYQTVSLEEINKNFNDLVVLWNTLRFYHVTHTILDRLENSLESSQKEDSTKNSIKGTDQELNVFYLRIVTYMAEGAYYQALDRIKDIFLSFPMTENEKICFLYLEAESYFCLKQYLKAKDIYRKIYQEDPFYRLVEQRIFEIEKS